jgi:translation initiation factor 2B subunit (eIF-2B alpha/beta/delta family)
VYVVASRDKAMPPALATRWRLPEAGGEEVWPDAPGHVRVLNRYFEPIPAELVTLFLTDAGPVAPENLPDLVARGAPAISRLLEMIS